MTDKGKDNIISIVEMRKKEIEQDAVMDRVIAALVEATKGLRDGTDTIEQAEEKVLAARRKFTKKEG